MKVFIGADHRGFELKEALRPWLENQGYEVVDCGNTKLVPDDDHPDFSFAVADNVVKDLQSRGIVICGSGMGATIAANKVIGIRCSTGLNSDEVKDGRSHDDINMLAISANYTSSSDAKTMIQSFLSTDFSGKDKYIRRLDKIRSREHSICKCDKGCSC